MISSPFEAKALALAENWQRYLGELQSFSADPVPLESQGLLVRVAGLVLEAAGIRVPVGSVCEVRMEGQAPVIAEVVGFSGDRAYLMPTGELQGLANRGYTDGFYQRHHTQDHQNYMRGASETDRSQYVGDVLGIADGWALVALGVFFVVADVVALEIARRVWQRGEVIGRI